MLIPSSKIIYKKSLWVITNTAGSFCTYVVVTKTSYSHFSLMAVRNIAGSYMYCSFNLRKHRQQTLLSLSHFVNSQHLSLSVKSTVRSHHLLRNLNHIISSQHLSLNVKNTVSNNHLLLSRKTMSAATACGLVWETLSEVITNRLVWQTQCEKHCQQSLLTVKSDKHIHSCLLIRVRNATALLVA